MTLDDIEDKETVLIIKIPDSKTRVQRKFIIDGETNNGVKVLDLYRKYVLLRSPKTSHRRLFVCYRNGKCSVQVIGKNMISKVPNAIAKYLGKENADKYTGHCLRRSSATFLVDAGGDILSLKRHGGWKSTSVAEGYVADSIPNKRRTANNIIRGEHSQTEVHPTPLIIESIATENQQPSTSNTNRCSENSTLSNIENTNMSLVSEALSSGFSIKTANNCVFNITVNK